MRLPRLAKSARFLVPVAAAVLMGGTAYGYMANNQVNGSNVGEGSQAISGYNVSGIHYQITAQPGDPDNVSSVSFNITPATNSNKPAKQVAVWFNGDKNTVLDNGTGGGCSLVSAPTSNGTEGFSCAITGSMDIEASNPMALNVAAAG